MSKFIFKEDSQTKRFGILKNGQKPPPVYSFDGRMSAWTKRIKTWDDPKFWTKESGIEYLKNTFVEATDWVCQFIADKNYPASGEILFSWDGSQWTKYSPAIASEKYFRFKLWIPVKNAPAKIFFTKSYFAMEELSFQYQKWRLENPTLILNGYGQVYGSREQLFSFGEQVPRFAYFDTQKNTAYYHNTRRAIDVYEF